MPLYEYECTACHKRTEKIQKFSDPEITVCPKCGGVLERVITAPAISFKGGGWFADGYGNAKPAAGAAEALGAAGSSKEGGGGSESKPAGDGAASAPAAATAPAATSTPAASTPAASAPASKA